jgi:hypothetical protein
MGRYITTTGTAGTVTRINAGTAYTAIVNDRILCTAGGQTITLPVSTSCIDGDTVQVIDAFGNSSGSNITIARNGPANIQLLAENLTINVNNSTTTLVYSTALGWLIIK